ncbi:nostrin isoform X2 [Esox lucius]|uniref:Osteoclast-stimulating factor 1 n=1 Tax=Esox lucius TaxID=8010 RepID=A0AAY5L9P5_ESOLU|nr:nostrin isoform X2 [Esox lucius]
MPDPVSTCTYNLLYQDLKRFSKNGEHFCKELMTVFQQRAELEISYAKGLQKLAGKLLKVSKGMNGNSTYQAWCHVSDEMFSTADTHRALGNALQAEAISDIRQVIEEHNKRKRTLDTVVEKTRKNVNTNWSEQIKVKKTLFGLTREHEDLFNFVENNAHICTEKEKQKMLNRLTKSAEAQTRADEQYFNINMDGHQIRLKWENALKNCYQIIQELEKQRLEVLCKILNKYNLYMASFRQTLIHSQKQIEQAIQRVDVEKDILILLEETSGTAEDNKAEFLMTDYFEENSKSLMEKGRRKEAIRSKLLRLEDCITKTKKDCDGLDRLIKNYSDNPSFSSKNNLEETEQLLEEATLKLDLLEATHYKLSTTLAELDGKPKSSHKFSDSITKWKEKDCEHSIVQLARPVKIRKTPFRLHLRSSVNYKRPSVSVKLTEPSSMKDNDNYRTGIQDGAASQECMSANRAMSKNETEERGAQWICIGKCKALYDFTSDKEDELNMKEGDLLEIYQKEDSGWWYGILNGQIGHFPSTYVEELPMLSVVETFDV